VLGGQELDFALVGLTATTPLARAPWSLLLSSSFSGPLASLVPLAFQAITLDVLGLLPSLSAHPVLDPAFGTPGGYVCDGVSTVS
jgi:hypothetical protein